MTNPFHYGEIVTGDNFADRQDELSSLVSELQGSSRIFLVSPRRYGKSSLLANVMIELKKKGLLVAYIDLYKTPSIRTFVELYSSLITRAGQSKFEEVASLVKEYLPNLRPKISLDSLEGTTISFDVNFQAENIQKRLCDVYELPQRIAQKKKKKFIIIIDEFQEIAELGGIAIEKEMRAVIQTHKNVNYVFAGSKQDLLLNMVRDKSRAFYQMGKITMLGKIPRDEFTPFLRDKFLRIRYSVSVDTINRILDIVDDFPHNAQFLCHEIWELQRDKRKINFEDVEKALTKILENSSQLYLNLWDTCRANCVNRVDIARRIDEFKIIHA
ncbi:MAG: ATP-binding protein [Bacteroidota bacterium]|nr:ATP-binding protein [Bacteroidota bacterium]